MKGDEASYYVFTDYKPSVPPLSPFLSFMLYHLDPSLSSDQGIISTNAVSKTSPVSNANALLSTALRKAFEEDLSIVWEAEDYSFTFPMPLGEPIKYMR